MVSQPVFPANEGPSRRPAAAGKASQAASKPGSSWPRPAAPSPGFRVIFAILGWTQRTCFPESRVVLRLEFLPLKVRRPLLFAAPRSFLAQCISAFILAAVAVSLTSCAKDYYRFPTYTYANRPVPPSKLANRVMVAVTQGGSSGSLQILDGSRDIRSNIQNTIRSFAISGFSAADPIQILNFPEQISAYVYSPAAPASTAPGTLTTINYGTESASGGVGSYSAVASSVAATADHQRIYSTQETTGQLLVLDNTTGTQYALNLPNVFKVAVNEGDTIALAMVRNSDTLYRVVKLNANAPEPPGFVDCQPYVLPVYCVIPVPGTYDHPVDAYFSLDGTTAYVLNCGPECGGATAGMTLLQESALTIYTIPTSLPYASPVSGTLAVPGGATVALSDGMTIYVAGQQLQPDGLFAGTLSAVNEASNSVTATYSISDGYHTKLLFADDNTLWIGSQQCGNGERAKLGLNYNCLTRFDTSAKAAQIIPNVTPGGTTTVPYPNENDNQFYYGDLTGLCWVQNLHKVYTAYGGQVHAFNTADGSEINNYYITVQGTALDVAYMDAITNSAN